MLRFANIGEPFWPRPVLLEEILSLNAKHNQGTRTDLGFEIPHQLSSYEQAEKALQLEKNIPEISERLESITNQNYHKNIVKNSTQSYEDRKTRTQIAKVAKVSSNTIARAK